jgi:hypothetical protein
VATEDDPKIRRNGVTESDGADPHRLRAKKIVAAASLEYRGDILFRPFDTLSILFGNWRDNAEQAENIKKFFRQKYRRRLIYHNMFIISSIRRSIRSGLVGELSTM